MPIRTAHSQCIHVYAFDCSTKDDRHRVLISAAINDGTFPLGSLHSSQNALVIVGHRHPRCLRNRTRIRLEVKNKPFDIPTPPFPDISHLSLSWRGLHTAVPRGFHRIQHKSNQMLIDPPADHRTGSAVGYAWNFCRSVSALPSESFFRMELPHIKVHSSICVNANRIRSLQIAEKTARIAPNSTASEGALFSEENDSLFLIVFTKSGWVGSCCNFL
jgi:hypothetical protein